MSELLPLFVQLQGRRVVIVGGGPVAASKLAALAAAGADVLVVAPEVHADIDAAGVAIVRRGFQPSDLDGAWLVVAAATPDVNRVVAAAAASRRLFVNAVDDPANASAFLSGVIRRDGVTLAISTNGDAPGLTALVRAGLDQLLPADLGLWMDEARRRRIAWKREAITMADRRPLLLKALNDLYPTAKVSFDAKKPLDPHTAGVQPAGDAPASIGHVSLVGAGPGDPGLLTRTAVAKLRAADLVLYDALVDDRVLHLARKAQRFFVGKRAGRQALSQAAIHRVMIRAARRGRRVVRLKGGDPFVFGRGGEEALALKQAGVPFDLVPGVTSALAGPALAGIPVTHRGAASAAMIVSGHDEAAFAAAIGALPPTGMTLLVLMGLSRRQALGSRLIDAGWAARTPAAVVADASTSRQEVWRGSLGDLAAGRSLVIGDGPGILVIGQVAAMALTAGPIPELAAEADADVTAPIGASGRRK